MRRKQIKSVLNYMKAIKYFRKISYERIAYSEMIDPMFDKNFNSDKLIENTKISFESNKRDILELYVSDSIKTFYKTIKNNIPWIYKNDKLIYNKLCISCLLSFTDRITLNKCVRDIYLNKYDKNVTFNNCNYLSKKLNSDSVILWHLPKEYENVVRIILNRSYNKFVEEVKEAINDMKVSDKEMSDIWATGFDNETDS